MDYNSIQQDPTHNNNVNPKITEKTRCFLYDIQKFSLIFIYLSYLHDQQTFSFFLRCVTQGILYTIPDIDELSILQSLFTIEESLTLQMTRINLVITVIIPYIILNFIMSFTMHLRWLYIIFTDANNNNNNNNDNSITRLFPLNEFINSVTNYTLNNTKWIYNSMFVEIIGESNIICNDSSFTRSMYLICLDILIVLLQLTMVHILRQRLKQGSVENIENSSLTQSESISRSRSVIITIK